MTNIPPAGDHGGDGALVARTLGVAPEEVLDLSQSLNPVASDPGPVVSAHLGAIGRYPDLAPAHAALAATMGIDPDRLLLTNGGAEAINLVAAELGGSVTEPEFSLHPRGNGPLWRSDPHNPTGLLARPDDVAAVWDEAFFPMATGQWTRGDDQAVVVGSLTKLLACPGLRIGYVLAEPALVDTCRSRQSEWAVNGLAAAALPDLLAGIHLENTRSAVEELRSQLRSLLEDHGLTVLPSDANWVLVDHPDLRDLLAPEAVVVRSCASFGLPELTRIAVPDAAGLGRLDRALGTVLGTDEAPTCPDDRTIR